MQGSSLFHAFVEAFARCKELVKYAGTCGFVGFNTFCCEAPMELAFDTAIKTDQTLHNRIDGAQPLPFFIVGDCRAAGLGEADSSSCEQIVVLE